MRNMKKISLAILTLLFLTIVLVFTYSSAYVQSYDSQRQKTPLTQRENPANYPKNTRERYIASIALSEGITYKEAERLENENARDYRLPPSEVEAYKTIEKVSGTVRDVASRDVNISTEVKYIKNFYNGKFVRIENLGEPYIYMPGVSFGSFSSGGFNKYNYGSYGRISATGSVKYNIGFTFGVSAGIADVVDVTGGLIGGLNITTKAKTFAMYIWKSDF